MKGKFSARQDAESPVFMKLISAFTNVFSVLLSLSLGLMAGCQVSPAESSSSPENGRTRAIHPGLEAVSGVTPAPSQCAPLANRIDELDVLILREEQSADQASRQAHESCRGESAVDCNYWTGRAQSTLRQVREKQQEKQRLLIEKTDIGCR